MRVSTKLFLASALLLAPTAFGGGVVQKGARGVFISIDGLQPLLLEGLGEQGVLDQPKGLGWLRDNSLVVDRADPVVTLTAASHVSTVTCSVPSRHGIVANNFIKDGKKVSGYAYPFTAEPLWRAAMRQGKKTMVLAYVGADATTPERTADYSLAYPDDTLLAPGQQLTFVLADLPATKDATVKIVLNPKTNETVEVRAVFGADAAGKPTVALGDFGGLGGDRDVKAVVNAYFTETSDASTLKGAKRRVFFRLLAQPDPAKVVLYVSKASYNNAYPASFRAQLDAQDLVWPDYGVHASGLSVDETVTGQLMIDAFLADVGDKFVDALGIDLLFFYNPIIDTLGHSYEAKLPRPIDAAATDEVTRAFVRGFKQVDRNVSRLLAHFGPQDVFALMGDHGMEPIHKSVNLAAILPPDQVDKIEVVASGAMTLVYPKQIGADSAESRVLAAEAAGQTLLEKIKATSFEGKPVFGRSFHKSDYAAPGSAADYKTEWQYGEALWVFTSGEGFWFGFNALSAGNHVVFTDPAALGMHGHDVSVPSQATQLLIHAPGVASRHIPTGSLIDAAPTFARLLGIQPPANCLGHSLITE